MRLAIEDPDKTVRKKAINALSSATRNFQPGLDAAVESLPEQFKVDRKLDAANMDDVDVVIQRLRDESANKA